MRRREARDREQGRCCGRQLVGEVDVADVQEVFHEKRVIIREVSGNVKGNRALLQRRLPQHPTQGGKKPGAPEGCACRRAQTQRQEMAGRGVGDKHTERPMFQERRGRSCERRGEGAEGRGDVWMRILGGERGGDAVDGRGGGGGRSGEGQPRRGRGSFGVARGSLEKQSSVGRGEGCHVQLWHYGDARGVQSVEVYQLPVLIDDHAAGETPQGRRLDKENVCGAKGAAQQVEEKRRGVRARRSGQERDRGIGKGGVEGCGGPRQHLA